MIKPQIRAIFASAALALSLLASLPANAADLYKLDPSHTEVVFSWNHFGFSHPTGKFMNATGQVTLDEASPAKSSVEVTFAIDGLNTGVPALDTHLKSADFFDAATWPTATFKSTKVEVTGKDAARVTGDLTIHGITRPVTLDVKLGKIAPNMRQIKTAGFTATGTILRSQFGIAKYLPAVGDEISLVISAEAGVQ